MSYNKIDDYQSYFINIANNLFILGEPLPPKITKINGLTFTEWDKFEYNVDYSLEDLKNIIGKQFNTTINMITIGTTILYADFNNTDTSSTELIPPPTVNGILICFAIRVTSSDNVFLFSFCGCLFSFGVSFIYLFIFSFYPFSRNLPPENKQSVTGHRLLCYRLLG